MKYKIIFLIFFLTLFSDFANAQYAWLEKSPSKLRFGRADVSLSEIQGSPYLDKEFRIGTVLTTDNLTYRDIPLRYNCFDDVLEFIKNDVSYEMMPKTLIKRAEFGDKVFSYKDYESGKSVSKSFFSLLTEGKATLCSRYTIRFYEPEPLKAYSEPVPARFADFNEKFYISLNGAPAKVITNNKKLIEILSDKKGEIESFIAKQRLSYKKAEDLKKIIAYYNSL